MKHRLTKISASAALAALVMATGLGGSDIAPARADESGVPPVMVLGESSPIGVQTVFGTLATLQAQRAVLEAELDAAVAADATAEVSEIDLQIDSIDEQITDAEKLLQATGVQGPISNSPNRS